jgi:hypothetical protein
MVLSFLTIAGFAQTKEERDLASFTGVSLSLSADVLLTQGSPQTVIIEADDSDLENIVTVVRGGILEIKKEPLWRRNMKNVTIWITVPEVDGLYLSGSGSILSEKTLTSQELEIRISGSGKIDLRELQGDELSIAISGSGNTYLAGNADEADITISGSGGIKAPSLQVSECSVRVSGSGSCAIDATGELAARISGSGRVTYFSNPEIDAAISGSGRVKKGNM